MNRSLSARCQAWALELGLLALATLLTVAADGASHREAPSPLAHDEADQLFGLTNVWTVHLKVTAENWAKMEPEKPPRAALPPRFDVPQHGPADHRPDFVFPPERPPGDGRNRPALFLRRFQLHFPTVPATVEFEGKTFDNVGLRFKGNSSYRSSQYSLKRPFKIDFNEYVKGQKFFGLTKLSLNNAAMDASFLREVLAYEAFREAGVPAPRTAYAKVFITVPGKHDRACAGLYTMVENVDDRFLKRHFGTKKGLLLKPETRSGLPYLGESWSPYERAYGVKSGDVNGADKSRFIALTKLVNGREATFREQIASFMDVDGFLRFLAVNVATANLDSFLSMGHNYYLFLLPETQQVTWIPWDLNEAFGGFVRGGRPEQQIDLSIDDPHGGENDLIERVLAVPQYKEAYRKYLGQIAASFRSGQVRSNLDALIPVLRPLVANEPRVTVEQFETSVFRSATNRVAERSGLPTPTPGETPGDERIPGAFGPRRAIGPPLQVWLTRRAESIMEQLARKREGVPPREGLPGMRGPAEPRGFEPRGFGPPP